MLFQTRKNVPDVYTNNSRDFQLFESLLDCLFNTILSNQYKENYIDDLELVDSKLLSLEADYLGFFTSQYFPEKLLRSILISFPDIIKNKGSEKGIQIALSSLENAYTSINYITFQKTGDYSWDIISDGIPIDRNYIDEVLKYVIPAGGIIQNVRVIQDINNLPPENIGEDEKITFFNPYYQDSGSPEYIFGMIRISDRISNPDNEDEDEDLSNQLFSSVGNTPIVTTSKSVIIKQGTN